MHVSEYGVAHISNSIPVIPAWSNTHSKNSAIDSKNTIRRSFASPSIVHFFASGESTRSMISYILICLRSTSSDRQFFPLLSFCFYACVDGALPSSPATVSIGDMTTSFLKCTNRRVIKDRTAKSMNPSKAKTWLALPLPCVYLWKEAYRIIFWLARTTRTPRKNPTENDVGNRLRTKVPRTPNARCIKPVQMAAMVSATDPSPDCCKLTTVTMIISWGNSQFDFR